MIFTKLLRSDQPGENYPAFNLIAKAGEEKQLNGAATVFFCHYG